MRATSFLALALLFAAAACRKNKDDGGGGGTSETTAQKVSTILRATDGAAAAYRDGWAQSGDSLKALDAMCQYLVSQSTVEAVYLKDIDAVRVHYKNGLWGSIVLQKVDASGKRLTRGGGDGKPSEGYIRTYTVGGGAKGTQSSMNISNNKVLVFSPYFNEFYGSGTYPFLSKFDQAPQPLEVTVVAEKAATLEVLKTAKDYGFIILDTHGSVGGFYLYTGSGKLDEPKAPQGPQLSDAEVQAALAEAENLPADKLESGEVELATTLLVPETPAQAPEIKKMHATKVTYKYIRASMPMLDEAVVYGNHCYSGWAVDGDVQNNLSNAWMSRGAITYYGYQYPDGQSALVLNDFCKRMEDSLISNLVRGDSTGVAHLANDLAEQNYRVPSRRFLKYNEVKFENGSSTYNSWNVTLQVPMIFRHFHQPTYSYGCGTLTDARDGEKYKVACIGRQAWMAENLRYNAPGSRAYDNNTANIATYGRMYNYSTVSAGAGTVAPTSFGLRGICPQGWHLPSKRDVDTLLATMVRKRGTSFTGVQLKSKSPLWTNDQQLGHPLRNIWNFSAMPAGLGNGNPTSFSGKGEETFFWLSSRHPGSDPGDVIAVYGLDEDDDFLFDEGATQDDGWFISCRCVQD